MAPPPRKRKKGVIAAVVAGIVTLLLVGGVGAWAASKRWFDSGDQPEMAMPSSVSLYGRLDLDPSLDQTTKLFNLARKFPKVEENAGNGLGDLEKKVFESLELKNMSYDSDVKPWFDHKVGVGLWADKQSQPFVLAALSSSDDGKAKAALKKVKDQDSDGQFGYSVKDGYALLAVGEKNSQKAAEEAASEARQSNLDGDDAFSATLGKMPKGQVAIGWADFEKLRQVQKSVLGTSLFSDLSDEEIPADLTGHALVAAQAGANGFEFRLRMTGLKSTPKFEQDTLPALGKMPGNTIVAAGYSGAADSKSLFNIGGLDSLSDIRELDKSAGTQGLVKALFEAKLVTVAFTGMKSDEPLLNFTVDARSDSDASAISKALKEYATESKAKLKASGTSVELATPGYSGSGAPLGEQQLYRDAMSGMPGTCGLAAYVNITALLDATDAAADDRKNVGPLKAIGAGFGIDGGDVSVLVRAVL